MKTIYRIPQRRGFQPDENFADAIEAQLLRGEGRPEIVEVPNDYVLRQDDQVFERWITA